jgi:rRNA maturation endonuclease Nob1
MRFDTFASGGCCPGCGTVFETTGCPECGQQTARDRWLVAEEIQR